MLYFVKHLTLFNKLYCFICVKCITFAQTNHNSIMYRIKDILTQKGMTAKTLAERMGVTPQYISGIIRETGSASVGVLANIAKELDVPMAALFDDYDRCDNNCISVECPYCHNKLTVVLKEQPPRLTD